MKTVNTNSKTRKYQLQVTVKSIFVQVMMSHYISNPSGTNAEVLRSADGLETDRTGWRLNSIKTLESIFA